MDSDYRLIVWLIGILAMIIVIPICLSIVLDSAC